MKAFDARCTDDSLVSLNSDDPKFQKENLRRISLKQELHRALQRESCFQFIVVIVFMVGFLILMLTHEDILHVYTLENVVKKTLTKPYGEHSLNFKEVQDVVEIWKWMDYGLLPAIVRHTDPVLIVVVSQGLFCSALFP